MKPDPTHVSASPTPLSRREFLISLALWSGWGGLGLALLEALRVPAYQPAERRVEVGRPQDIAAGVTPLPLYQAWLVRNQHGFYALKAVCPHLGCPPEWRPLQSQFVCPCHDSRFDREGGLRQGPALRALERYEIQLNQSGNLVLNLDRSYRRENGGWQLPGAFVSWPA
ncbi:MAG: hypothetical protein CVV27_03130 [Candidatus Melainabacteria bacterium HGW-Melainabacteria-1]|nr:MAG: hypothetical protein CVV27_03130 [Candidatus Melainabacteria bacterium HGW-Melainabacteria-1]